MASLVCWSSGLLDVMMDKDVPPQGPIVLATGTAGRMRTLMTAHGMFVDEDDVYGWYVPGTTLVPTKDRPDIDVQRDRLSLVQAFNTKLVLAQAKLKGRAHYLETLKQLNGGDA